MIVFCPSSRKGIDAIDQIDAELFADLLHAGHGVVEIALDLHRERAVVEGLREFAIRNLARANKNQRPSSIA